MKTLPFFIALIFVGLYLSEQKINCSNMPEDWITETEAIFCIENTAFKSKESIIAKESSWFKSAQYYSCDGKIGHLIIKRHKNSVVHKNVPLSIWQGMKVAKSIQKFYDNFIRNRYKTVNQGSILALL